MNIQVKKLKIIRRIVAPTMSRIEAWKVVQAEGLIIPWADFKRIAGQLKLKFREEL